MSRVEQPAYQVLRSDGSIQVRAYDAMIAAEVALQGERSAALANGFQLIAGYIFGSNKPNAKIAMTAPVEQRGVQKIAMTAPVSQQADGDRWTVRFIMPRGWTMETLPAPTDPRVVLTSIEARVMLAIRFSGTTDGSLIASKTDELRRYATGQHIETTGEPLLAFYNPPWTLPLFRRNEVMLAVK